MQVIPYSYANDKKFNLVLIVLTCMCVCVCVRTYLIVISNSHRAPSILLSLLVSIIESTWSKQATKRLNDRMSERLSKLRVCMGCWRKRWKWQRTASQYVYWWGRKKNTARHSNSCGYGKSKYTPACIILHSILIHLFASTIQNIVIHVIHLSTQTFRFSLFFFAHSLIHSRFHSRLSLAFHPPSLFAFFSFWGCSLHARCDPHLLLTRFFTLSLSLSLDSALWRSDCQ